MTIVLKDSLSYLLSRYSVIQELSCQKYSDYILFFLGGYRCHLLKIPLFNIKEIEFCRLEFLNLSTTNILGWIILHW